MRKCVKEMKQCLKKMRKCPSMMSACPIRRLGTNMNQKQANQAGTGTTRQRRRASHPIAEFDNAIGLNIYRTNTMKFKSSYMTADEVFGRGWLLRGISIGKK